jgi:YVTN family beta-propeller protein
MPVLRSMPHLPVPRSTGLVRGTIGNQNLTSAAPGFGRLWVLEQPWKVVHDIYRNLQARVLSVDLRTRRLQARRIPVGRGASGIAVGAGSVWVVNTDDGSVSRIDPKTRRVTATIAVGGRNLGKLAVSHASVWVLREDYDTLKQGGELIRIDPVTNTVIGRTVLGKNMCGSFGLAASADAIWVSADAQGTVIRIDPATGDIVTRIHVDGAPIGPVVTQGTVWVANESEGAVREWRIDLTTNQPRVVEGFRGFGWMLEPAGGKFWTTDGATVSMIDPETQVVELAMALPNAYEFVVVAHRLWTISWDSTGTAAVRWVDLRAPVALLDLPASRVA